MTKHVLRFERATHATPQAHRCALCGRDFVTLEAYVLKADTLELGPVCPACLEAGPQAAAERFRAIAANYRENARQFAELEQEGADLVCQIRQQIEIAQTNRQTNERGADLFSKCARNVGKMAPWPQGVTGRVQVAKMTT